MMIATLLITRVSELSSLSEFTVRAISERNRPDNPPPLPDYSCHNLKVGLQAGHWNNQHPPAELSWLVGNTGSYGGGLMEWESNYRIASQAKQLIEQYGVQVDLLEAVVPPRYAADVFVSIHADGSDNNPDARGFKIAGPEQDWSGKSRQLTNAIRNQYAQTTKMNEDSKNITRGMTEYYSFSPDRFEHAIHPSTPATLLETGFLSNLGDQYFLVEHPEIPGEGLAKGIIDFLDAQPGVDPC